jgi:hypothetical protein
MNNLYDKFGVVQLFLPLIYLVMQLIKCIFLTLRLLIPLAITVFEVLNHPP